MFKSKLPEIGDSIFSKMSALSVRHGAINLAQGFPDFEIENDLKQFIKKAVDTNQNQYYPMAGLLDLRKKLSAKYRNFYGVNYSAENEITITSGATEAIFISVLSCVQPGDEVIVIDPSYDSYVPAIDVAGGKAKRFATFYPDFAVNWDDLEKLVTQKTKVIITNNPNNPACKMFSEADMLALQNIVVKHNLFHIADEVYEHIFFDKPFYSCNQFEDLRKRSFLISSFGKTFHATGWKVGYVLANEFFTNEFRKIHQFNVFSVNSLGQYACNAFAENEFRYSVLPDFYKTKRNFFLKMLSNEAFLVRPTESTYFQLVDYSSYSSMNDVDFCTWLTVEHGVSAIPLSAFYGEAIDERIVRFCFAKKEETLFNATNILNKL